MGRHHSHPPGPVQPGDHGRAGGPVAAIDHQPARRGLLHRRQRPAGPARPPREAGGGGHAVHCNQRRCAAPVSARAAAAGAGVWQAWPSCDARRRLPARAVRRRPQQGRSPRRLAAALTAGSTPPSSSSPSCSRREGHALALVGGPVRDAVLGRTRARPRLHHGRAPRRDAPPAARAGATRCGTSARPTGRSAPGAGDARGRGDHLPHGALRPGLPQARGRLRRQPRGGPAPAGLHRQRDGRRSCPSLTFVDPFGGLDDLVRRRAAHARAPRRSPSTTTRCA